MPARLRRRSADRSGSAAPWPVQERRQRLAPWQWGALTGCLLALVLLILLNAVRLDYVILSPGPAINTLASVDDKGARTPRITVTGHPAYPASGALDFTTIIRSGGPGEPVSLFSYLEAKVRGYEIYRTEDLYPPNVTQQQVRQQDTRAMTSAQDDAAVVAIRAAGGKVTERLEVADYLDGTKARALLRKGDVIVALNGQPVESLESLHQRLGALKAGTVVQLGVLRGGKQVQVKVPTITGSNGTAVGVALSSSYNFPYQVKVDAGDVGGPSAGLMFSLAIYDTLTPGDMTAGQKIAGTGTIDPEGHVGPIGGITQKMIGARSADARYFLAPADNCQDVRGHVPDGLQVIRVGTFTEGRAAVQRIAAGQAAGLPAC